ncbi:hypothetical protein MPNT_310015 [Candidatus Methylacidithermus pantelleriae]|uniref:Uncharacterized protein n=1 Tax=Candidatus Methylacidithermus pantelleriae TaxID=2744239 RepID=A0A8J2BQQ4_9BACT|nr:hypothetical protein MPNT_310015 [Candidatus Methylacidithermus pantelleriae]
MHDYRSDRQLLCRKRQTPLLPHPPSGLVANILSVGPRTQLHADIRHEEPSVSLSFSLLATVFFAVSVSLNYLVVARTQTGRRSREPLANGPRKADSIVPCFPLDPFRRRRARCPLALAADPRKGGIPLRGGNECARGASSNSTVSS